MTEDNNNNNNNNNFITVLFVCIDDRGYERGPRMEQTLRPHLVEELRSCPRIQIIRER